MASAKFLEEALSTDVDESAVSAIVGSLETQLGSAAPPPTSAAPPQVTQNHHVNATVSNGATNVVVGGPPPPVAVSQPQQKHPNMANGDSVSLASVDQVNQQQQQQQQQVKSVPEQPVKIVQLNQAMSGATGAILQNRVTLPNGTISLPQQKVVLKTSGGPGAPAGLVTVPVQQANNVDAAQAATSQAQNIISGLQVVNVRPGMQPQKGQPARVVLSAPQLVGARPGTPQLTLQSFHGLQPGQQGALLLKTENGQYQLLRVGPPPTAVSQATGQPVAYRMQTVPVTAVSATTTPIQTSTISSTTPAVHQDQAGQQTPQQTTPQVQQVHVQQQQPRPANDNTKEKCRKFLANLLELSSREPKAVEKNVRTLIQELIDNKVEPEDFCDKLERLLNASPQPCLIGFLKKSLPLLRHSLATQEMTIDGIRPPAADVVFSVAGAAPTVQTAVRPGLANQVRIVGQAATTTVNRPGQQVIQQRLVAPVRTQTPGVATATVPVSQMQVVRPQQQQQPPQQQQQQQVHPPALHPVYANSGQPVRAVASGVVRQPVQVRQVAPGVMAAGQVPRHQLQIRQVAPAISPASHRAAAPVSRPPPPPKGAGQVAGKQQLKDKEKKTFQSAAAAAAAAASASAAYGGDDDINDVAAMGGVNLAEETQKILGSTEFVGTQIRSCKEEPICLMQPLQQKIRSAVQKYGLDEPTTIDVAACVSHAAQERLKNLLEKLAVITEHRLENVRTDNRYEVTNDVKGQLKFLEDLDKAERKRHEETERELLLRAAKSRSKSEDPEQAKLKAKAKEMQRVEMEELRQREANATALQAIGPRKKPKLDGDPMTGGPQASTGGPNSTLRAQMPLRQRMKKATLRDLQFLFETEKDLCKSKLLYRSYLK